jgi:hypothetical protein
LDEDHGGLEAGLRILKKCPSEHETMCASEHEAIICLNFVCTSNSICPNTSPYLKGEHRLTKAKVQNSLKFLLIFVSAFQNSVNRKSLVQRRRINIVALSSRDSFEDGLRP